MAKAKKLPSGNWRVQLFVGLDENGKRKYESFTATTAKAAELMAAKRAIELEDGINKPLPPSKITVGDCIDAYIESREGIRAEKTIREYRGFRRNYLQGLMNVRLKALTAEKIQAEINREARIHSQKTVRNAWGLVAASLKHQNENLHFIISLPSKTRSNVAVLEEEDFQRILWRVNGTSMEIPIKLAAMCGLRRGEIAALDLKSDINYKRGVMSITKSATQNEDGEWECKSTKTYTSTRWVEVPQTLLPILKRACENGYSALSPNTISHRFVEIRDELGLKIRFHDLRHYYATTLLELGASYHYVAQRMGHANASMIEQRYGHVTRRMEEEMNQKIQNHYNGVMQHGMQHDFEDDDEKVKIVY